MSVWTPECNERQEESFRSKLAEVQESVGPEAFERMTLSFGLSIEAQLRKNCAADHPMLQLIDASRAKQERGFE
jgi:hypothetical protein